MTILAGLGNPGSKYSATKHNFGVWVLGSPGVYDIAYEKNLDGLIQCYLFAIPFFKNTLFSTLIFSYTTFAVYKFSYNVTAQLSSFKK